MASHRTTSQSCCSLHQNCPWDTHSNLQSPEHSPSVQQMETNSHLHFIFTGSKYHCHCYYYTRLTYSFLVNWYQKGKPSLDLNEAREDGLLWWYWHQLYHTKTICTLLQTDDHINALSLKFLQAGCSSWRPTNSVKALKASLLTQIQRPLTKLRHCYSLSPQKS